MCDIEEIKAAFINKVKEKEDILLDAANPARKAVAKLMLNSFGGKYGQRHIITLK